ncbi:MAG: hypothetical protein Q8P95_04800, partial [bacterium]|nr:hypothetical protein [bacterium]
MYRIVEAGRGDDGSLGQRLFVDGLARRDGGDEPVPAVSSGVMGTGRVVSRPNYQVRPPDDPNDRDLQWHQLSYHRYRLYDFVCRHFADAGDEFRLAVCWCIEERILKQDDSFREDTCQYVVVRRMAIDVMFDTIDPYLTEHPESQKTLETLFSIGLLPEGFSIDSLPPIPKKPAAHPSPGQRSSTDK